METLGAGAKRAKDHRNLCQGQRTCNIPQKYLIYNRNDLEIWGNYIIDTKNESNRHNNQTKKTTRKTKRTWATSTRYKKQLTQLQTERKNKRIQLITEETTGNVKKHRSRLVRKRLHQLTEEKRSAKQKNLELKNKLGATVSAIPGILKEMSDRIKQIITGNPERWGE